jgi:hypothetical protein
MPVGLFGHDVAQSGQRGLPAIQLVFQELM